MEWVIGSRLARFIPFIVTLMMFGGVVGGVLLLRERPPQEPMLLVLSQSEGFSMAPVGQTSFDTGGDALNSQGLSLVSGIASRLKDGPRKEVVVIGYADRQGEQRHFDNARLSKRRAETVVALLKNVAASNIQLRYFGLGSQFADACTRSISTYAPCSQDRQVEVWSRPIARDGETQSD